MDRSTIIKPIREKRVLLIMVVAVAAAIIFIFTLNCPFRALTGIPCPGCGMTRAFLCLLRLDPRGAFLYHPMFPLVIAWPLAFAAYFLSRPGWRQNGRQKGTVHAARSFFSARATMVFLILSIAGYFVVYVLRIIMPLIGIGDPFFLRLLLSG